MNFLHQYCAEKNLNIVGLTSSIHSNHLLRNSKYAVSTDTIDETMQQQCMKIVDSNHPEALFKEVKKIYHYNLSKYGKK